MSLAAAERLIAELIAHPRGVSSAAAASACGNAVDPVLDQLERRGYRVQRTAGSLLLEDGAVHFDPAAFERLRSGAWGTPFETWESVASTNDLARAGADDDAPHGALWLAEFQTHGRGRHGRSWICAPFAGLLVSGVLRWSMQASTRPQWLPLALGLGACEALRALGVPARTKWPNDIMVGESKLAGLLVETRSAATVFGLGMNVRPEAVAAGVDAAHFGSIAREELLARLLAGMESRAEDWSAGRFEELRAAWRALDCVLGRTLRVVTLEGECVARARGVTDAGLLDLELADGTCRQVAAGDVHLA